MKHLFNSLLVAGAIAASAVAPIASAAASQVEESICITSYNNEEMYRLPCSFAVTTHQDGYEFRGLVMPGQMLDRADNRFAEHIWCPYVEGQRVVEGKELSSFMNDKGEYEWTPVRCVYSNYQFGSVRIEYLVGGEGVSREFGFLHRGARAAYGF